jgi:hypothetical protein
MIGNDKSQNMNNIVCDTLNAIDIIKSVWGMKVRKNTRKEGLNSVNFFFWKSSFKDITVCIKDKLRVKWMTQRVLYWFTCYPGLRPILSYLESLSTKITKNKVVQTPSPRLPCSRCYWSSDFPCSRYSWSWDFFCLTTKDFYNKS